MQPTMVFNRCARATAMMRSAPVMPPHFMSFKFTPSTAAAKAGMSEAKQHDSSTTIGNGRFLYNAGNAASLPAANGCSTNSTPRVANHCSMVCASRTFQPPLASTRNCTARAGSPMSRNACSTAANIAWSASMPAGEPSFIFSARNLLPPSPLPSPSNCGTRSRATAGVEMPSVIEVGTVGRPRPTNWYSGIPARRARPSHNAMSNAANAFAGTPRRNARS